MSRQRLVSLESAEFELWQQKTAGGSSKPMDKEMLRRVIEERLTERQQEYLSDYYFGGMNIYEISKTRGIAPSTVSRTLRRARRRIFDALKYTFIR